MPTIKLSPAEEPQDIQPEVRTEAQPEEDTKPEPPTPKRVGNKADVHSPRVDALEKQQSDMMSMLSNIIGTLEGLKANSAPVTVSPVAAGVVDEGGPTIADSVPVPPSWEKMKNEILSPEIPGFREDMPSGEIKYNLFIPQHISTADQQHWLNYRVDKRTIVVKNGERSVKEGLIKIRNNLVAGGKQGFLVQYP